MQSIKAIYDGNEFKPIEPIPFKGECEVTIIFPDPVDTIEEKLKILSRTFGTWDEEDAKEIEEIIKDRANFFKGRDDDFS
ncbi:MAG: antitoxin family protein [Candidatus Cloacimonetes bacterium]|nr:antitoxin family protein [Candidatus Cloacimonadota bacterium]